MKKSTFLFMAVLVILCIGQKLYAEFPICTNSANQDSPAISGNIVVWRDDRNGNYNIYGYDIQTGIEFPICTNSAPQYSPAISGNIVVWRDDRNGNLDIYGYDIDTNTEFLICTNSANQSSPSISGNIVVWQDDRNGNCDIYGYDIDAGMEFLICTNSERQSGPAISGNIVVWYDQRSGNYDIYGYDIDTNTEFPICTNPANQWLYPSAISGNIVVWVDERNGNNDIYGYDIDTGMEFPICTNSANQYFPAISGNIVVWLDNRSGNYDIYGYDIDTNTEFPICTNSAANQSSLAIGGNIVVCAQSPIPIPVYDIYGYDISGNNECINATEVVEDIPYYGSTTDSLGGESLSSCSYNDFQDVWHWFTPVESGDYVISLCGSNFDTTLLVLGGCGGEEVVCNDDYCGKQSLVILKARAGYKYIIRVAGHDGSKGEYTLNITRGAIMKSDINGDRKVDFIDFSQMASEWLLDGTE